MILVDRIYVRVRDFYLTTKYSKLANAFAVSSHLTIPERVKLFELAVGAQTIAEIGSYVGASACCFGAAAKAARTGKIVCVDTWQNDAMTEGNRDTWKEFQDNTRDYRDFIEPVRGLSTEVIERVRQVVPRLDVLFIDGDHSYEGAKADWESYSGLLHPGSTVIFHDYGWAEGVKRVVHEDVMSHVTRHDRLPNMWWGQMK